MRSHQRVMCFLRLECIFGTPWTWHYLPGFEDACDGTERKDGNEMVRRNTRMRHPE